jgi:hypothetical protein
MMPSPPLLRSPPLSNNSVVIGGHNNNDQNASNGEDQPWGTVRVAVRVRPFVAGERPDLSSSSSGISSAGCVCFSPDDPSEIIVGQKSFTFDFLFKPSSSQELVFEKCAASLVDRFVQGYNATILAYGQTGSGKFLKKFRFCYVLNLFSLSQVKLLQWELDLQIFLIMKLGSFLE